MIVEVVEEDEVLVAVVEVVVEEEELVEAVVVFVGDADADANANDNVADDGGGVFGFESSSD